MHVLSIEAEMAMPVLLELRPVIRAVISARWFERVRIGDSGDGWLGSFDVEDEKDRRVGRDQM